MISFRSAGGISEGEIYRERRLNARSTKESSRHALSQSAGSCGIFSGMKRPPSEARPFRTTSSNDSYSSQITISVRIAGGSCCTYAVLAASGTQITLRWSVSGIMSSICAIRLC